MAKRFYLIVDGEQSGPVDAAALKQLAASGSLKPTDKLRREDMSEWYVAKNVTGLFTAGAQATTETSAKRVQASSPKSAQGSELPKTQATLSTAETLIWPWRRFKNPWAKAAVFVACCAIVIPLSKWAGRFLGAQMADRTVARETAVGSRADVPSLNGPSKTQSNTTPSTEEIPSSNEPNEKQSNTTPQTRGSKDNSTSSALPIEQPFTRVQLDHGMNLSIPTSWNVFDKDWNSLIRQSSQALQGDISGMSDGGLSRTTILRMTCNPRHLYGSLTINVYHNPLIPPEDITEIAKSPELLEQLKEAFINEALRSKSITLVGDSGISSLQVAGHPAVRVSYQRKGFMDDHVVQSHMTRIFLSDKTYSITSSYRVIEKELLAPILDASIKSISFDEVKGLRHPKPSSPLARTSQLNQASLDQALIEVSKSLNAGLPMQVDKDTRFDTTTAGPGNRLTYHYTLVNYTISELDPSKITTAIRPSLVDTYRNHPEMATFREMQVELHYKYRDKDGTNVATIIVSPKDL